MSLNDAVINLKVGDQVLLVDGRGCHVLHTVTDFDQWSVDEGFRLSGQCWDTFRFYVQEVTAHGVVFRSLEPAIGRIESSWHPTFCPKGWRSPSKLTAALQQMKAAS